MPAGSVGGTGSGGRHDRLSVRLILPTGLAERAAGTRLALSPDGSVVAIASGAGTQLWSIATAPPVLLQTIPGSANSVAALASHLEPRAEYKKTTPTIAFVIRPSKLR